MITRQAINRASVPTSSRAINRLEPAMSAAKIAASLRSTEWTGALGFSPSEYSEPRNRCAIFQAQIVAGKHRSLPAGRTQHGSAGKFGRAHDRSSR